MTNAFGHFHDYYSRTYPRYESYTSTEREHQLVTMMNSICRTNNRIFEHNLYYDLCGNINPVFKTNVLCAVGDSISSELSAPIIQQVTMILSSPEASVALSAPVVNLIANSKEIHTQTVNIVGQSLSTGEISNAVAIAVEKSFETDTVKESTAVQGVIVEKTGDALSSGTLSNEMFAATEITLANPEISTAMTTPVANVIPTSQVSANVVDVAAAGINIKKIIGNQGEDFPDNNNNGVPDEYDDNTVGFIFGDLGA